MFYSLTKLLQNIVEVNYDYAEYDYRKMYISLMIESGKYIICDNMVNIYYDRIYLTKVITSKIDIFNKYFYKIKDFLVDPKNTGDFSERIKVLIQQFCVVLQKAIDDERKQQGNTLKTTSLEILKRKACSCANPPSDDDIKMYMFQQTYDVVPINDEQKRMFATLSPECFSSCKGIGEIHFGNKCEEGSKIFCIQNINITPSGYIDIGTLDIKSSCVINNDTLTPEQKEAEEKKAQDYFNATKEQLKCELGFLKKDNYYTIINQNSKGINFSNLTGKVFYITSEKGEFIPDGSKQQFIPDLTASYTTCIVMPKNTQYDTNNIPIPSTLFVKDLPSNQYFLKRFESDSDETQFLNKNVVVNYQVNNIQYKYILHRNIINKVSQIYDLNLIIGSGTQMGVYSTENYMGMGKIFKGPLTMKITKENTEIKSIRVMEIGKDPLLSFYELSLYPKGICKFFEKEDFSGSILTLKKDVRYVDTSDFLDANPLACNYAVVMGEFEITINGENYKISSAKSNIADYISGLNLLVHKVEYLKDKPPEPDPEPDPKPEPVDPKTGKIN